MKLNDNLPLTIRVAEALGWQRFDRLGIEVWYDPEGGHVSWKDLPAAIESALDALIAEAGEPHPEDMAALERLVKKVGIPKPYDGPTDAQIESASDPRNRPLTPLENWQQNDEHHL